MQQLLGADFTVVSDIGCDYPQCDCGLAGREHCAKPRTIFSLRTEHDPSAGIFGQIVTPWLSSQEAVAAHIENLSQADFEKLLEG